LLESIETKILVYNHCSKEREGILREKRASFQDTGRFVDKPSKTLGGTLTRSALVFLASYLILFVGMSLRPNIFDEGIVLTGAMRVAAGQIPHQDFFANYGPAQYYILAGLFKLFRESILVERLFDLFIKALLVTFVYAIASSYCRRSVAACTSIVTVLWLFGLNALAGTAVMPVSLLNLIGSSLILPVFLHSVSIRRILAAGAVAGMAALFRYDTGVALLGVHACVIAIAVYLRFDGVSNRLRAFAFTFWPYLLGFAVVTLPALLYYLSVASLRHFVHDIIIYPSKYYHRGRNLPFPRITLKGLDNIGVYLPIAIIGISFYVAMACRLRARDNNESNFQNVPKEQMLPGFLITFGLLALAMYFKGFVRVSLYHMYLSIIPSLLLVAVLFQRRLILPRPVRISITLLTWLSITTAGWSSLREAKNLYVYHTSLPESMLVSARRASPETEAAWCKINNPLTEGLCFLPEDDRARTIEFIDSHTRPDQQLFVGVTKHDRVFANDNIIYFGTQRLPATKWSQFDPDLVNRYDIQTLMVHDLEVNAPPYIVLDSEFDLINEPNDSSKSSGVTLLDEYIHSKYQHVETFGEMSIWQRIVTP
jgi:hypothetical protein